MKKLKRNNENLMKKLFELEIGEIDKNYLQFLNKGFLINYEFFKVSLEIEKNKNEKLIEEIIKNEKEALNLKEEIKIIDKVLINFNLIKIFGKII